MEEVKQNRANNNVKKSLIKWILIFALIIFAALYNKEFTQSAITEIKKTPYKALLICLFLANLYFVIEGVIISQITKDGKKGLSVGKGIVCAYMCAFYRLTTLGSGNGIAQLYYYKINGINVSDATGMSLAQYTIQKISIAVFGIISYFGLTQLGNDYVSKYSKYMLMGTVLIFLICTALIFITLSKTISNFVMMLARKIVKEKSRFYPKLDKAQESINCLQNQGRRIWKNKLLTLWLMFLDLLKFACWYAIPGIIFSREFDVNIIMCIMLMAICNMIGCVMVAPSGVGTLEFVFAIFFSAVIPKARAIAATIILYRFFTWIVPCLIGMIPAMLVKKK